jgi:Ribonuclease G/E
MSITITIKPDLEKKIKWYANNEGLDIDAYLSRMIERQFQLPRVDETEAALLASINLGISSAVWERYAILKAKRDAETLNSAEHAELIEISDKIELANVERIKNLIKLAQYRDVPLRSLMEELGIKAA